MAAILNSAILYSAICTKKTSLMTQTHSLMTQLDDGSHLEFCHLGFRHCHLGFRHLVIFSQITQKHSPSTLTLTQTNSIWLTGWWQPSWILPSWIQPCCTKLWLNLIQSDSKSFILTQLDDGSHLELCHLVFSHLHKKTSLMHSHSNWWLQPSWILLSWIQPFCTKKKLHLFILTQLDDGSHLEICHVGFRHCHLGFRHLVIFSQITQKHSPSTLTLTQTNSIWLNWWWQPSWILPSWIQPCCTKLWLNLSSIWLKVIHSDSTWWWQPSWTLPSWIQPFAQKNFTHAFSLKLMIAAILNSAMLDSDTAILDSATLLFLSDSQKHSSSKLNLTQTNSFWLNLMMAAILILNSAILDSAMLHKTLTQTRSIWLKLIHSDSTWW